MTDSSLAGIGFYPSAFLLHPALALGAVSAVFFIALRIGWIQENILV
jgi:hypothetical protein